MPRWITTCLAKVVPATATTDMARKSVVTDTGRMALEVPRNRQGSFAPLLIAKYQRRFPGFDDKILSMYARGMSTREITGHLRDLYGIEVSPDLTSTVTDAVLDEIAAWQVSDTIPHGVSWRGRTVRNPF